MKKRVILTAVIMGALFELAAVIYTIHMRDKAVIGGEYFILPLFAALAYMVTEIIRAASVNSKQQVRLTETDKVWRCGLSHEHFPNTTRNAVTR